MDKTEVGRLCSLLDWHDVNKEAGMEAAVVGIDIGQASLVAAMGEMGTLRTFANGPAGHARLVRWVHHQAGALVVLEATGGYHLGIWEALEAAGIAVAVCHPTRVRFWMKGQGQRAKTDQVDARMLARYGRQERPAPTPIPSETRRTIAALLDRRGQLVKQRTAEKNRHRQTLVPAVQMGIAAHVAVLSGMIRDVERQVRHLVRSEPELAVLVARLRTVPGIAELTATRLAIELPELGTVSRKRLAALIGVAPVDRQSGKHRARASIGGGRASLRHGLYEPVLTTIRCDPTFHAHYVQLTNRGKSTKQARIACMRRLLGILNVMVRDELTWSETKVGKGGFLPHVA